MSSQSEQPRIPTNELGYEAFPQNSRFLSRSRLKDNTGRSRLGLEIGYHVPKTAQSHLIAELGRNADIMLPDDDALSSIHAVFEFSHTPCRILLRDRSGQASSVKCEPVSTQEMPAEEEGHIKFIWYITNGTQAMGKAIDGYEGSLRKARLRSSLNHPTDQIEPEKGWRYPPRVKTQSSLDSDVTAITEELKLLGRDRPGQIRLVKILNPKGGETCAVIKGFASAVGPVGSRALIKNEAKMMRYLNHKHIIEIEILVCQDGNEVIQIKMPQRHSLTTLTKLWFESGWIESRDWNAICCKVAEHLLSALAYLSGKSIIHLDVNPDNILYYLEAEGRSNDPGGSHRGGFQFQLANFAALEGMQTFCSLEGTPNHQDILLLIQKKITSQPLLQDTGKINPDERLSAADLLEKYFNNSRSIEPTAEAKRKEELAVARTCEIDMQDTEAPPPSGPPSQEIPSMQCIIYSPTRMRHPAERSAASRMPPPAKLTLESGVRKSGRATPNRTSRRTSRCPTPRIPRDFDLSH
ncbi:hypothetical protein PG997_015422 [Apiospora hydei]|uniref:Protein kinase domain-containing protein n=1 Tax=Apiospora hydei TaxID=1337664 RepID=A0ABR1UQK0_9PEZI